MVSKSSKKISKDKSMQISHPVTHVDATSKQATIRPRELRQYSGTTVAVDHHRHTLPPRPSGKCLIPKPWGAAGKVSTGGYSLQDAMGLKGDKGCYNGYMHEIRIIANSMLERKKTFRQQPPSLINEVVLEANPKVQIKFPFFQQFTDGWLICDVLKCMLLNQKHDAKYRLDMSWNKDYHNKEGNEPNEQDDSDVQPESEEEVNCTPAPAKKTAKKTTYKKTTDIMPDKQDDSDIQPESEEQVNHTLAPAKKTAKKTTHKKTVDIMKKKTVLKAPIANPKSKGEKGATATMSKSSGTKAASSLPAKEPPKGNKNMNSSLDAEFEELISVEVQHMGIKESDNIPAKLKHKHVMMVVWWIFLYCQTISSLMIMMQESEDEPDITEQQPIPPSAQNDGNDCATGLFKCPRDGCFENLPTNISSLLAELLDVCQVHLTAEGPFSVSVACEELEICLEITKCRQGEVLLQQALTFRWPTVIDFKLIPPHVKVLEGEVQRLLTSSDAKESCYVFNLFSGNFITEKKFGMNRRQALDSFSKHKNFKMTAPLDIYKYMTGSRDVGNMLQGLDD
ncbi:hypothetical protein EDB19DRAFT_1830123 [Suillus lakei]|nr:hypothetical protein EDB19DRAFT_1830123 [Suillus lakei]